jgi:phage recombination protein Bet
MKLTATISDMDTDLAELADIKNLDIDDLRARIEDIAKNEGKEPESIARQILDDARAQQETAITPVENKRSRSLVNITDEQATLLKAVGRMPQDATRVEMDFAFEVANRLNLDPMRKQIQFIRFQKGKPIEPYISIGGLEAIAARSKDWAGADLPMLERDEDGKLVAATVTVYRIVHGVRCGFSARAILSEFMKKDSYTWPTMPTHMLEKVALANALRMAFPEEISDIYVEEEVN